MPTFSVTVSPTTAGRVTDAFAALYGWQATIAGAPNPETKAAFTTRRLREHIREVVTAHEAQLAGAAARQAAADKAAAEIIVT